MSKTFFDMGYKNTFNELRWMMPWEKEEPINKEDYWVTKFFYSITPIDSYWRSVEAVLDNNVYNTYSLKLSCGHYGTASLISIKNLGSIKYIRVNCMDCGGTGKIEIR